MDQMTTTNIIESVKQGSPAAKRLRQEWLSKSPEEKVLAGHQFLYGIVTPALAETGGDPDNITEVTAFFEALFESVEQGTRSRSRSGTQSS